MEEEKEVVVDDLGFEDITGDDEVIEPEPIEEELTDDEPEPTPDEPASDEPMEQEETVADAEEQLPDPIDDAGDDSVDDKPVDEVAALREQNEALLAHVESLSSQVLGGAMPSQTEQAAEPKETQSAQAPVPQTPNEVMNFLENTSIDDLLEDPTKFNAVLNQVSQQSTSKAVQGAVQQVLRSVPELVMNYITRHSVMNRMVDDFYKENADLDNVKQTVAAVANDIHAKNPGLSVEEVFKQSADKTRKLLGLKQQAKMAAQRKPAKPAFAKAGGARKTAPAVSPIQQEINDLLSGDF